jgi:hypothetical protein
MLKKMIKIKETSQLEEFIAKINRTFGSGCKILLHIISYLAQNHSNDVSMGKR